MQKICKNVDLQLTVWGMQMTLIGVASEHFCHAILKIRNQKALRLKLKTPWISHIEIPIYPLLH